MKIVSKQPAYVWVWETAPHFLGKKFGQRDGYKWQRCSQWIHAEKYYTAKQARESIKWLKTQPKLRTFKKSEMTDLKLVKISGISLNISKIF